MAPCSSSTGRPVVFATAEEIPPWKGRVSPVTTPPRQPVSAGAVSPGFVQADEMMEIHAWFRELYTECRYGEDTRVEVFLRALLEETRTVEFFDRQPQIAKFIGRFVAKVAGNEDRSASIRRLAHIVLKAFFIYRSDWE